MFMSSRTDLLVTDAAKGELEASDLEGLAFRPVELAHVTRVVWQAWDTEADEPGFYPSSGEPEGFAVDGLHDADLARSMGPVWEVVLEPWATVPDADLASGTPETCEVRASFAAARWIGARYGEWIDAELRRPRR
jgi:hypothetical protein